MSEVKQERVEVIVLKDFPKPNGRAFVSIYKRDDGHNILKPSTPELIDDIAATLRGIGITFFAETSEAIFIPGKYWQSKIKPVVMKRYNCYSSSEIPKPMFIEDHEIEIIDEPHRIMPESTEVSVELEDNAGKLVFTHTPTKIVPRRKPTLTMRIGDDSITFIATKANLKAFVAGFKDIIRMIISIEE